MRRTVSLSSAVLATSMACISPSVPILAVTIAADDASRYAYTNGWQAGDNGGTGFGAWTFAFSGNRSDLLNDPQFINRAPAPGDHLGTPSFALTTGDRPTFSDTSEVLRTLSSPLSVGETFSVDIDGSSLDPGASAFSTGNTLQLFGNDGQERFALYTTNQYHSNNWTATSDANTGIPAANAFHVAFTLATSNTYNLTVTPIGGGAPLFSQSGAALDGTAGSSIQSIRFSVYGTGSSADGSRELFFDNLLISSSTVSGDYNKNGVVDAADYVVWRNTFGQTGSGLSADGNGNNAIDTNDYSVWRTNFALAAASSPAGKVPEPVGAHLYLPCAIFLITIRIRLRYSRLRHCPRPYYENCYQTARGPLLPGRGLQIPSEPDVHS